MEREKWITAFREETDMFSTLWDHIEADEATTFPSKQARWGVIEAALLHTRLLSEFFLDRKKYPGDLSLIDLWPSFQSARIVDLSSVWEGGGGSHRESVNKRLLHFTKKRPRQFDWALILADVVPVLRELIQEVDRYAPSA